jgi:hypothetical protein
MATYLDDRYNPHHRVMHVSLVVLSALFTFLAGLLVAALVSHGRWT